MLVLPGTGSFVPMRAHGVRWGERIRGMICLPCRERHHDDCPGGTWCDCQHLPPREDTEPALGWIRQG
jgi:hypothetical protein